MTRECLSHTTTFCLPVSWPWCVAAVLDFRAREIVLQCLPLPFFLQWHYGCRGVAVNELFYSRENAIVCVRLVASGDGKFQSIVYISHANYLVRCCLHISLQICPWIGFSSPLRLKSSLNTFIPGLRVWACAAGMQLVSYPLYVSSVETLARQSLF